MKAKEFAAKIAALAEKENLNVVAAAQDPESTDVRDIALAFSGTGKSEFAAMVALLSSGEFSKETTARIGAACVAVSLDINPTDPERFFSWLLLKAKGYGGVVGGPARS